jgi:mannose-1-phosphate guanylyltransferase/phosphomannomutase
VRIQAGKPDWVLVLPDADRPIFNVFAESRNHEQAQALADRYARVVTSFQQ